MKYNEPTTLFEKYNRVESDKINLTGMRIEKPHQTLKSQQVNIKLKTETTMYDSVTLHELEVLYWAANGMSTKATAEHIEKSVYQIKKHRRNAIKKLKANSISHAVYIACQMGLI